METQSPRAFEEWELPYARIIRDAFRNARPFEFTDAGTRPPEPWELFRAEQKREV